MKIVVTVLMSVYNCKYFLREAIESVLNQSYHDFEFIIIDDGSDDESKKIISSYPDNRIRFVVNEKNIGLARSLNKGIKLSKGKYIMRMDGDDVSLPYRIESLVSFLENNPQIGLCGSWVKSFGTRKNQVWKYPRHHSEIKSRLIFDPPFAHPAIMFRKEVLDQNQLQYDESLNTAQDYDLWTRMVDLTQTANLDKVLLKYRIHGQSVTMKTNHQALDSLNIRAKQISHLKLIPSTEEIQLHEKISRWDFSFDNQTIWKVSEWLVKLRKANVKIGYFPDPAFTRVISERWFLAYKSIKELNFKNWLEFWQSSLSKYLRISKYRKFKFLAKSLLTRGLRHLFTL